MRHREAFRVMWNESRAELGVYLVIGEWNGRTWEFSERDSWEVRWFPIPATRDYVAKANRLARQDRIRATPDGREDAVRSSRPAAEQPL